MAQPQQRMGPNNRRVRRKSARPHRKQPWHVSDDGVETLRVQDERPDVGFYNAATDKATQTPLEIIYATSHGILYNHGGFTSLVPEAKRVESARPFTALAASAVGDRKFGRFVTQALAPANPAKLSASEEWAISWHWKEPQGDVPKGGLIAAACDVFNGERWYLLYTGGF